MKCTTIGASNLLWFEGEDENTRYDDFLIDISSRSCRMVMMYIR